MPKSIPHSGAAKAARVTLRGLTVAGRVRAVGDLVPLDSMPDDLRATVEAGGHPHLELVRVRRATRSDDSDAVED